MATKAESKLSNILQECYIAVALARYEEERAKAFTVDEIEAFRARWTNIADQLEQGWILNPEEV
jgi:hypothetical protein